VTLTGHNADVLRRQADGSWRFVIDNPWGTG
jgi:ketosteroid isomerase-like protein